MTTVRLAVASTRTETCRRAFDGSNGRPGLLASYWYLKRFLRNRGTWSYRDWVLDSGAFSADVSGAKIDLRAYTETAKELLATDPTLVEVYSLDVIGDSVATMKNTAALWEAGVRAIPTFHVGGKVADLRAMTREFPKIALGGAVGYRKKREWAQACFREVWPTKIHGFGFGTRRDILAVPWHSVDATNWETAPVRFGKWHGLGRSQRDYVLSVRGNSQDLSCEVAYFLRVEREARYRWRKQMKELDEEATS